MLKSVYVCGTSSVCPFLSDIYPLHSQPSQSVAESCCFSNIPFAYPPSHCHYPNSDSHYLNYCNSLFRGCSVSNPSLRSFYNQLVGLFSQWTAVIIRFPGLKNINDSLFLDSSSKPLNRFSIISSLCVLQDFVIHPPLHNPHTTLTLLFAIP